jgi:hypothetical protein
MSAPSVRPKQSVGGCHQGFIHWSWVAGTGLAAVGFLASLIVCLPAAIATRQAVRDDAEDLVQSVARPTDLADTATAVVEPAPTKVADETKTPADEQPETQPQQTITDSESMSQPAPAPAVETRPPEPPAVVLPQTPETKPAAAVKALKRRDRLTAHELRGQLRAVPEVRLDAAAAIVPLLLRAQLAKRDDTQKASILVTQDARFSGLPFRQEDYCQLDQDVAQTLQDLARILHPLLDQGGDAQTREKAIRAVLFEPDKNGQQSWKQAKAIPTLMQLMQPGDKRTRLLLVEALAQIQDSAATNALARRALFDLSPEVREAAVRALQTRSTRETRPVLLGGLRYPWPPIADHAAEALVALGDRDAILELKELVNQPDPRAVFGGRDKPTLQGVRELVRINHLHNCFLCHAPATVSTNLVLGQVPVPSKPLPVAPYYGSHSPSTVIAGNFVRADVTYLKQDFSVPQPVLRSGPWPIEQRHDYVVRTRKPTAEERAALENPLADYPQKQAVLFALRELRAENIGIAEHSPPESLGPALAPNEKTVAVGDRVQAQCRRRTWRSGVVLSRANGNYLIQYDGSGTQANEWVARDRIRVKQWE